MKFLAWLAYTTAYLYRVIAKKFPKSYLELIGEKKESKAQSPDEMKTLVRMINKTLGGEERKR